MIVVHNLDRSRVFITGLSAGGAMTSVMLSTYPEVFSGGAIIAGLPYGIASTMPQAFDAMRGHGGLNATQLGLATREASDHTGPWPRVSIWHGSADATVSPVNSQMIAEQWLSAHGVPKARARHEVGDGHCRTVWQAATRDEIVELCVIPGMAHGAPIDTRDGLSVASPFMIDVGVSSTAHICQFWGISVGRFGNNRIEKEPVIEGARGSGIERRRTIEARKSGPGQVIEDALRAAGLMR